MAPREDYQYVVQDVIEAFAGILYQDIAGECGMHSSPEMVSFVTGLARA